MKKLRLLITKKCPKNCDGCCNKDWDLDSLETETSYAGYDEIMITGGEPMLTPGIVFKICGDIRKENKQARIIVYTALIERLAIINALLTVDGITITLHTQEDADKFDKYRLAETLKLWLDNVSIRINIFKGICVSSNLDQFQVKSDIEWIKNSPLPKDEAFKLWSGMLRV